MSERVGQKLDSRRSHFIAAFGKKGSGKSFLAQRFWDTWPGDRLVIDVCGDIDAGEDTTLLRDPLPMHWPTGMDGERVSLRYVPDPGSGEYRDDLDRAVGLAFGHRGSLLWIDEVGEVTNANATGPNMRRALQQGRHRDLSMIMCGPRSIDINPLVISQADLVYVFDVPHPRDRERIAAVIGYPPKDFDAAVHELGEHEYLRWDGEELVAFPALPKNAGQPTREARLATT